MQDEYVIPWQHVSPICSSPKEKLLPNIDVVRKSVAKSHASPYSVLTRQPYSIVVSIPAEKHNIYL
jgi:hypothetical protein